MRNNILWGNTATASGNEIYLDTSATITLTYSDVQGGWEGTGNINADPLFVGGGNYHLQEGSTCIDSGISDGAPAKDREGTLRPQGAGYDMGAYEYIDPNPPEVGIITPQANQALQDGVTFQAQVTDASAIDKVLFSLREPDGGEGTPIGHDDLAATFNTATGYWKYPFFDTTVLQDGYYVIFAKATDTAENEGISAVVTFSIRNWAVITLLPSTPNNNAGRTMPVKFSLRIAASVDPAMPFVYNEDLEIRIYDAKSPGTILQRAVFGNGSTNYRINGEMYNTNFKTGKTPTTYVVEIWRPTKNFMLGSFTFKTVK